MSDKKTKIECRLITHGTNKAKAKVIGDLNVPDPEPAIGEQILQEEMNKESNNDRKQGTS
jgi:hypothetical protein